MISMKPSQLPRLRPGSWISLDTETSGFYPDDGARVSTASVAWFTADEIEPSGVPGSDGVAGVAFPFAHGVEIQPWFSGAFALFGGDEDVNLSVDEWAIFIAWLADKHIVMHNAGYDLIMMSAGPSEWMGYDGGPVLDDRVQWDTMLGCKNLWPTELKALGPTAKRLGLGTKLGDPVKAWIKKNKAQYVKQGYPSWGSGYDLVPWIIMGEYAAEDAVLTLKVFRVQQQMFLDGFGDWAEFDVKMMPLMKQFVRMERRGLPYPRVRSAGYVGVLEGAQVKVGKSLPFTPTKTAAVKYFFESGTTARGIECLNLDPIKVTDSGNVSLDADVIGDLAYDGVPWAKDWKLWTDLGRVSSMYYGGYADKTGKDGRLRARIRQIRDITKDSDGMGDRLSIERVNLQAMPQDRKLAGALEGLNMPTVRELIAQEVDENYPGWELWELDLSQAELRVGALLSGCTQMLKAFNEGRDLHQDTADLVRIDRKTAKMSNFLLIFDGGWLTFKTQVKIQTGGDIRLTASQAKNIVYPWKRTYPQFKRMADKWEYFAKRTGYVPLANGVLRWFTFREDKRKAWNQRVQGSIQHMFQDWLLEAEEICERWGVQELAAGEGIGGAGPLMTVHDSIILLLPSGVREQIVKEIQDAAIRLWDDMFPGVPGAVDAKAFGKD